MTTKSIFPLLLCLFASPLTAQRVRSHISFGDREAGQYLYCRIYQAGGATSVARWAWQIGDAWGGGDISLPSDIGGGATRLEDNVLLVSGFDGTNGWLAEVAFSAVGSSVTASLTSTAIGPLDLVSPTYDRVHGLLYAVDNSTHTLLVASYSRGFLLGPWQVVTGPANCPLLKRASSFYVIEPIPNAVGVEVIGLDYLIGVWDRQMIRDMGGAWTIMDPSAGAPTVSLPPAWKVSAYPEMTQSSTEFRLWIGGGSGPFWIAENDTGAVVFTGNHGGAVTGEVFTIPSWALESGKLYFVASGANSGFRRSGVFQAEHVWPRASVGPNMVPAKVGIRTDFPVVGTDFVSWELYWRSTAPQNQQVLVTMLAGGWDYGTDPTIQALGIEMLAVSYGDLGVQIGNWDNRGQLSFGWAINVNNPSFVGLRVAVQAIGLLPTGEFIASNVAGVVMVP